MGCFGGVLIFGRGVGIRYRWGEGFSCDWINALESEALDLDRKE